jgi:Mn-dependent DtxR family transcriptional regulator
VTPRVVMIVQKGMETSMPTKHNHSRDFHIMLGIMNYIDQEKGYFENLEELLGFDKQTMKLWLESMVAMGYLQKAASREYYLTEKGKRELKFHSMC